MDDERELHCDVRGPNGVECTLPPGHPGDTHQFEVELPAHIGQLIAQYVDNLEECQKEMDARLRGLRRTRWILLSVAAFNVLIAAYYFALILNVI